MTLSVVIPALGLRDPMPAVASVHASLAAAEAPGTIVLVWQGADDPPVSPDGVDVDVVACLPAGPAHARNVGAERAAAEPLIAFVDDDEVVEPGWAEGALLGFGDGADAVFGPVRPMDGPGVPHCALDTGPARWVEGWERPWGIGTGGNMAVTREAFRAAGGFDARLGSGAFGRSGEDAMLIARLRRAGARLRWEPAMAVRHPRVDEARRLASRRDYGFGAGRVVRTLPDPALAGRHGLDILRTARLAAGARDGRGAREVAATAAGFVAGGVRRDRWRTPLRLLDRMPPEVAAAFPARDPRPLPVPHRRDLHFLVEGDGRMLHVYLQPTAVHDASLAARRALERWGRPDGVPALRAAVRDRAALWVVEDRAPGAPVDPRHPDAWWPGAVDLLVRLGGSHGAGAGAAGAAPPLRAGGWWRDAHAELPAALPVHAPAVAAALEHLGDVPGAVVHGDAQPKNLLADGAGRVSLVDWEGAIADGPPGLDLLFLAVTARGRPDPAPLVALAAAGDARRRPVFPALDAVGVGAMRAEAALVALASWVAAERSAARPARDFEALVAVAAWPLAQRVAISR